jgi:hypothetical protein
MLSPAEPKLCCPAHVSCPSKPQFPRMRFGGNSPFCIKRGAFERHDFYHVHLALTLGGIMLFESTRSVLL